MRFETSQQMKLGQHMKLAPRMIQSMEILQLPTLALQERIEQELESNVTLELTEPGDNAGDTEPLDLGPEPSSDGQPPAEKEPTLQIDESGASDFERLDSMEKDYGEAFDNEYSAAGIRQTSEYEPTTYNRARMDGERDGKMDAMANTAARSAGFAEQLLEQWSMAEPPDDERAAGELIISNIDSDGYLRTPLETIVDRAPQDGERPTVEKLERALARLQSVLEPPGVAARDTRECLMLQLDAREREGLSPEDAAVVPSVRRLIGEHLDDLVQNRLPRIAQKSGLSLEEINAAVQWMQRLSVSPGRALVDETPPAIIPDASIEYDEDEDRYIARVDGGRLPGLRISPAYAQMVKDRATPKETREFVRTNLLNAQWLIDAIQQRAGTLQRVLNVVAEAQREYFDQGPQALRPLPMTQVADQLGVHVATVSRAVAGKHVQTPWGVVALRKFFTGGTQTDSGEEVSWDAIKAALSEIVGAEDRKSPLSDEQLVDELKKRGIDIARRTVAKYRTQLDIPSARMRKQF